MGQVPPLLPDNRRYQITELDQRIKPRACQNSANTDQLLLSYLFALTRTNTRSWNWK